MYITVWTYTTIYGSLAKHMYSVHIVEIQVHVNYNKLIHVIQ